MRYLEVIGIRLTGSTRRRQHQETERNTTLATALQALTLLVSFVSAIGVLIVDGKVDQLTGQVRSLQELPVTRVTTPGMRSD